MNWKVRLRNPVFWVQIVVSAFAAVLAYAGLTAADLTTWESVGALLCNCLLYTSPQDLTTIEKAPVRVPFLRPFIGTGGAGQKRSRPEGSAGKGAALSQ